MKKRYEKPGKQSSNIGQIVEGNLHCGNCEDCFREYNDLKEVFCKSLSICVTTHAHNRCRKSECPYVRVDDKARVTCRSCKNAEVRYPHVRRVHCTKITQDITSSYDNATKHPECPLIPKVEAVGFLEAFKEKAESQKQRIMHLEECLQKNKGKDRQIQQLEVCLKMKNDILKERRVRDEVSKEGYQETLSYLKKEHEAALLRVREGRDDQLMRLISKNCEAGEKLKTKLEKYQMLLHALERKNEEFKTEIRSLEDKAERQDQELLDIELEQRDYREQIKIFKKEGESQKFLIGKLKIERGVLSNALANAIASPPHKKEEEYKEMYKELKEDILISLHATVTDTGLIPIRNIQNIINSLTERE